MFALISQKTHDYCGTAKPLFKMLRAASAASVRALPTTSESGTDPIQSKELHELAQRHCSQLLSYDVPATSVRLKAVPKSRGWKVRPKKGKMHNDTRSYHFIRSLVWAGLASDKGLRIRERGRCPRIYSGAYQSLHSDFETRRYPADLRDSDSPLGYRWPGLFRVAGSSKRIQDLVSYFERHCRHCDEQKMLRLNLKVYDVAEAMKRYLRMLPEPLLTYDLIPAFKLASKCMRCISRTVSHSVTVQSDAKQCQAAQCLILLLPEENRLILETILITISRVLHASHEGNLMTPDSLATIFAPNLVWKPQEELDAFKFQEDVAVIRMLILYRDHLLFSAEVEPTDVDDMLETWLGKMNSLGAVPTPAAEAASSSSATCRTCMELRGALGEAARSCDAKERRIRDLQAKVQNGSDYWQAKYYRENARCHQLLTQLNARHDD